MYNVCTYLVKSNSQLTQCASRCHRYYQHSIAAIAAAFAARRNHAVPPSGPHIVQVLPPPSLAAQLAKKIQRQKSHAVLLKLKFKLFQNNVLIIIKS